MARSTRDRIEDDHLMAQFRAFYDEIIKAVQRSVDARDQEPEAVAQSVSKQLESLIELQTMESKREGNRYELESIADARYLKAALADEVLLSSEWVGRDFWTEHLLEACLFRTNVAGERIFERIEQVLSNREPSKRPIAGLYLSALALGFQGKYRGAKDLSRLNSYRLELFQFAYQRRPDLSGRDRVLSARAYESTLAHIEPRRMPTVSRWTVGFLLAFIALLTLSELAWLWQSWPVRLVLETGQASVMEVKK